MKTIDLTHTIAPVMPVYPGTEPPTFKPVGTAGVDGFRETLLTLYSHTGTHIDAPAHLFENGLTLDQLPIEHFVGKAVAIDCRQIGDEEEITLQCLMAASDRLEEVEFILFNTGRSQRWGHADYFSSFPVISMEVAGWIAERGLKGIGVDVISIDPVMDEMLPRHRKILQANKTILIENLCCLDKVGADVFTLCVLPLKTINADGAPARAIAIL